MTSKPGPPGHFGPPRQLTQVRLFGRFILWERYTWTRGKTIDEVIDGFLKPVEGAFEALGSVFGHKRTLKPEIDDPDASGPIDEDGKVKP